MLKTIHMMLHGERNTQNHKSAAREFNLYNDNNL